MECLSGGKVALIYYGSVALTFTVRQSCVKCQLFTDSELNTLGPAYNE